MAHIVIISPQKLFRAALADAVRHELGAEVSLLDDAASLDEISADALVSTIALDKRHAGRAMVYSPSSPRKMTSILADIARLLADKPPAALPLSASIMLDAKNRKLLHNATGGASELTEKEQALLLFIKDSGEAGREDILRNVWGFAPGADTHTLETHLYRLRQKWREFADYDCILATDKGYRWHE